MQDVAVGEVWEVYSPPESRWVRAVVMNIERDQVTLRYEGLLQFLTVTISDLHGNPDLFRPADPVPPA